MLSGNFVSATTILDKVMRKFRITEIDTETAMEAIADFLDHTKVPIVLEKKIKHLVVTDGRAMLPSDMTMLWQTALVTGVDSIEEAECGKGALCPMRWSTDTFHLRHHCEDSPDFEQDGTITYTLNKGFIYPNFNSGIIALSYFALPTDDEGYPLVPADEQWQKGAVFAVAYEWAFGAWHADEISDKKFQIIERDRDWYFAQAVNYSKVSMFLDRLESMKNDALRTIPRPDQHKEFYKNMQLPESRIFRRQSGFINETSDVTKTVSKNVTINTTTNSHPAP